RESEVGVQPIGAGKGEQAGEEVGGNQREVEKVIAGKEYPIIDGRVDHADEREACRLEHDRALAPRLCEATLQVLERRGDPHGGLPLSTSRRPRRGSPAATQAPARQPPM